MNAIDGCAATPYDTAIGACPVILRIADPADVRTAVRRSRNADRHGTAAVIVDPSANSGVDPFVIGAGIAAETSFARIGIVVPLDKWHPYPIARRLAQLDTLSAGRISWAPTGFDPLRRSEAVDIVAALLTSWPTVTGDYFSVDSPLDVPPGPQGVVPIFDHDEACGDASGTDVVPT